MSARFEIDGFRVELSEAGLLADPVAEARRVCDPKHAEETVHWGRNYLYSVRLEGSDGPIPAVVKTFRNQSWSRRLERRLKGSKAERSWGVALAMREAGLQTPQPLILMESERADGPSILVTRQVEDFVEARYLFRALKKGTLEEEFPQVEAERLVDAVAMTARRLHDAGFWHRDFSIGNLLVVSPTPGEPISLQLIDLNRTRIKGRVSVSERTRDLSRLSFYRPELQKRYLSSYWRGRERALGVKRALYSTYRAAYVARVEGKKRIRGVTTTLGQKLFLRKAYAHIPEPDDDAGARDKAVWDSLSDQPHQHATRWERLGVRLGDVGSHAKALGAAATSLPRARRRYSELRATVWSEAVPWPGAGVGVGPGSGALGKQVERIERLGVGQVLLRVHPWEENLDRERELARELSARDRDLVIAIPQNRELVCDPSRWRSAVRAIGEAFLPYANRFQVGQAINRSKWGLWNYGEYVELIAGAAAELRALGEVELLGPAVIDFEPHAMAAALNYPGDWPRFDIVSGLLYVDRRGAPENEQLGHDALGKATLSRAIGETAKQGSRRYWVTEVNWPLWEGPHSPAGRKVSVDERSQADYLVRYYLPLLGSGIAERVYWWQLAAKGYGLVDPTESRERPSFHALSTLERQLEGSSCHGPVDSPSGTRLFRFTHPDRGELLVAWSLTDPIEIDLPSSPSTIVECDGNERDFTDGRVTLTGSPQYFWLD